MGIIFKKRSDQWSDQSPVVKLVKSQPPKGGMRCDYEPLLREQLHEIMPLRVWLETSAGLAEDASDPLPCQTTDTAPQKGIEFLVPSSGKATASE